MSMMRIALGLEVAAEAMGRMRADLSACPAAQPPTSSGRFGRLRHRLETLAAAEWERCHDDAARLERRTIELALSVRVAADAYASADAEEEERWTR